jgi:hypothetical protein
MVRSPHSPEFASDLGLLGGCAMKTLRHIMRHGFYAAEPAHLAALAADVGHRTGERRADAGRCSLRFQVASEAVLEGLPRASR